MKRALAALVALTASAHADPWKAQTEAGVAYDTNVRRVEQGVGPEGAPAGRASARVEARGGEVTRLRWGLVVGGGVRRVLSGPVKSEDAQIGSLDLNAIRRAGDHLQLGARASHYEVWPPTATRAYATSGADLSVTIGDDRGRRASISFGARRMVYKRDADFDWTAPALAVLVEDPLWRGDDDRAIDLAAGYRMERRTYAGNAYQNGCAPGEPLDVSCFVPSDRVRADLLHFVGVRAIYTGARVASLGYELTVDDSTSFGSSLTRQRVTGSVTTPLPAKLFATVTVIAQLDHYPEPQLIAADVTVQKLESFDEESRSNVAIRVARALDKRWQLEARWSIYAAGFAGDETPFRRQVAYAGVTWER